MASIGAAGAVPHAKDPPHPERLLALLAEIGAAADLDAALVALARGAIALLGGDQGAVRAYDVDGRGRHVALWVWPNGTTAPDVHPEPPAGSVAADLKHGGAARVIDDLWQLDPGLSDEERERKRQGMRSSVAVSIEAGGQRIGSLHIDHHEIGYFSPDDLTLAQMLASHAGVVIERARQVARREADAAVRRSERRYRTLIEQSPLPIQVFAPDGEAVAANAAWERLWGVSRSELEGYNILRDPQLRVKGVLPFVERAFAGEAVDIPPIYYDPAEIGKPGRARWLRAHCYAVLEDAGGGTNSAHDSGRIRNGGSLLEVVLLIEDVTGQVEAQEQRDRLTSELRYQLDRTKTITDNATSCLIQLDARGYPLYINPAFERVTGYTLDEIKDRPVHYAVHYKYPDGRPYPMEECPIDSAYPIMQPVPYGEEVFVRKDGTVFPVAFAVAPLERDGQNVGAVVEFRDITLQKEAEEERERLLALEQQARTVAEAASRLRDEFLTVAAHELKTPMTSLRGYAQVTLRRLEREGTLTAERVRTTLEAIDQQTLRLARLVEQLLDVSRIASGRLDLQRQHIDVVGLVRAETDGAQARTDQHTLVLSVSDQPLLAWVDPLRLEQVLTNLLDNAIRYSPEGGLIEVTVSRHDERVQIAVRDRGLGIPAEQRDHLFDRFYQAHADQHRSGLGLGLFIAKQIVDLHGGTITAAFPEDGGSRFAVSLPL